MELWILATVVAFFVKGLCGFANTLVFTSIIGFGSSNVNISPVELVLGFPSNIILVYKNRKKLNWRIYVPLTALIIAGSIPGAFMLKYVNAQYIKIFFGVVTVLIGIEMMLKEYNLIKSRESKLIMFIVGVVSGVLCGLFGIGILLAAYVSSVTKSSSEFKANLSAVFVADNIFRIVLYSVLGVINLASLKQSAMLAPIMLLALFLGMKSSRLLDEKLAKKLVIVLLIISGVALVGSQL